MSSLQATLRYHTNHMKNLYEELPHHLNKQEKKLFEEAVVDTFSGKEC